MGKREIHMTDPTSVPAIWCTCLVAALLWSHSATAAPDLCEQAAAAAAAQSGVPADVLLAVTLTETGRNTSGTLRPWPWTVNVSGEGHWFATARDAVDFAVQAQAEGKTNFDIGCFQLNYRWHNTAFPSVSAMFDPTENALYAARFLSDLYVQHGDWATAAGAYHSATQKHAKRYRARFDAILAGLSHKPQDAEPRQIASLNLNEIPLSTRENRFPLLNGGVGSVGSLVPLQTGGRRLIGN